MCEGRRTKEKGRWGARAFGSIGLILLLVLASLPVGAKNPTARVEWDWSIETIDASSGSGRYSSLRLFPSDRQAAAAYYSAAQGDLKYAYHDGERWNIETVDAAGDVGQYASLALDSLGHPHIAYYNATSGDLKYASWTGTSWTIATVDATGDVGKYASLALYDSFWPCIAYYDVTNGNLKYAWFDGAIWNKEGVETIHDNVGQYASLALDSSGHPHIAYYDVANGDLKYARKDAGGWDVEVVDAAGDVGQYASLSLDSSDLPHIAYYDAGNGDLKYAYFNGTAWYVGVVDAWGDVGRYASLSLDSSDLPHIAYYDGTNGDLRYAHYDGTTWHFQTVYAPGITGLYASLALDTRGRPYIAFYDDTDAVLKWAYFCYPPESSFEVSPAPYCVGSTITLTNTTVSTWTVSYLWSFGDGITSTLKNPTHAYEDAGLYPVVLTAATGCGTDAFSRTLPVWDTPSASFEHSAPACVNRVVAFTSTSQVSGTASYTWEFGDKTGVVTGTAHPTHIYTATGTYVVMLQVRNECGWDWTAEPLTVYDVPAVSFEHGPNPSCGTVAFTNTTSGAVAFLWDFGDGITSTITNPVHTYTSGGLYTVTLTAWGEGGCADTAASVQEIWEAVSGAEAAWSPAEPVSGEVVTFTARAEGTPPISFTWDFGDGNWGFGPVVTHTYAATGTYTVVLTASNACGWVSAVYTVSVAPPCEAPSGAGFTWEPITPTAGEAVTFTGTVETGTPPFTYTWDFGDSGYGSGPVVTHTYTAAGTYAVVLAVSNTCGQDAAVYTVSVVPPCEAPFGADFTWEPITPTAGEAVTFTGTVSAGTPPFTYTWDFGDGTQVYGPAVVTHTYGSSGRYTVTSAVWNGCGIAYSSASLEVSSPPASAFRIYLPLLAKGSYRGDAFEPDDTPELARLLLPGQPQRHSFGWRGDVDWVYLNLTAGTTYYIETQDLAGGADPILDLYVHGYYDSPLVHSDDDCGSFAACFEFVPSLSGHYDLRITNYEGGGHWGPEVQYTLEVTAR